MTKQEWLPIAQFDTTPYEDIDIAMRGKRLPGRILLWGNGGTDPVGVNRIWTLYSVLRDEGVTYFSAEERNWVGDHIEVSPILFMEIAEPTVSTPARKMIAGQLVLGFRNFAIRDQVGSILHQYLTTGPDLDMRIELSDSRSTLRLKIPYDSESELSALEHCVELIHSALGGSAFSDIVWGGFLTIDGLPAHPVPNTLTRKFQCRGYN